MSKPTKFLLLVLVFIALNVNSYSQSWLNKIVPMETNLPELKKLLAVEPYKTLQDKKFFKLKEGNLSVWFSQGKCVAGAWGKWNVDEGTILSISFYPKKRRKPSYYNLDKKGMKEFVNGSIIYLSDEKGLSFTIQSEKVTNIDYYPSSQYEYLRCKEEKQNSN